MNVHHSPARRYLNPGRFSQPPPITFPQIFSQLKVNMKLIQRQEQTCVMEKDAAIPLFMW